MSTASPHIEWSNEKIIDFLELYETERVIWDPSDKNHKFKHKVHDAWNRISMLLNNTPIEELKYKKKSLMATFRSLLKRKKASIRSGADADDIFQPTWFAFELMERFLGTLYDVDETLNTEYMNLHTEYEIQSEPGIGTQAQSDDEQPLLSSSQQSQTVPLSSQADPSLTPVYNRTNKIKTKVRNEIEETQNKISQTLDTLNEVLKGKRNCSNEKNEDECDLYAKLLAKKLRKYPDLMRGKIMYQIDGLLLQNPYPVDPLSAYSFYASSPSPQSQHSDFQVQSPPPMQQSQRVHIIQPSAQRDSSVQILITTDRKESFNNETKNELLMRE